MSSSSPTDPEPAGAPAHGQSSPPGRAIVRASWATTVVFTVVMAAGAWGPPAALVPATVVAVGMFLAGCAAFAWGYGTAVGRSRQRAIDLAGLFFLTGTAPAGVRRLLLGSAATQAAVALVAALVRPATAAGILAPVHGLALAALWAARYGDFPARRRH